MARKRHGFTLVELLVVVGIIALLVTILMPSLGRALELTRRTICLTNLHSLGRGWIMYFQDNDYAIPEMRDLRSNQFDNVSQFDFLVWTANANPPGWISSGMLFKEKLVGSKDNYICPTIRKNSGGNWYHKTNGSYWNRYPNAWPLSDDYRSGHATTTYSRRRVTYYDDSALAQIVNQDDPRNKEMILSMTGAKGISKPGEFSFMADSFHWPEVALLSHVPRINVLYLDGHVGMWEDENENVIYDNDVTTWGAQNNWTLDKVWMIIDGYMARPPAS